MTIDINKKYRTRDGREVRIYSVDGGGHWPIHGSIKDDLHPFWVQTSWDENGKYHYPEGDLVEAKPRIKRTVWLNVMHHNVIAFFSKKSADRNGGLRVACVPVEIDCEEGEGLT